MENMMKLVFYSFCLLTMITNIVPVCLSCPRECDCFINNHDWLVVNCTAQMLETIPLDIPNNTTMLMITHNNITALDKNSFGGGTYSNMLCLYASDNKIERLKKTSFRGLLNLWYINLIRNRIQFIHAGTFDSIKTLEYLYLDENPIFSIGVEGSSFLNSMTSLVKLGLSSCNISQLSDSAFLGMESLKELDLSGNQLITLNSSTFRTLTNLEWLFLSDCSITNVQSEFFRVLPKLTYIRLSENPLDVSSVRSLLNLEQLESLDLSMCDIKSIPENIPDHETNLHYLNLSGNYLHNIDLILFDNMKSLNYFDISHNPLYCDCSSKMLRNGLQDRAVRIFWPQYCVTEEDDDESDEFAKEWLAVVCPITTSGSHGININNIILIFCVSAGGFLVVLAIVFIIVRCRKARNTKFYNRNGSEDSKMQVLYGQVKNPEENGGYYCNVDTPRDDYQVDISG